MKHRYFKQIHPATAALMLVMLLGTFFVGGCLNGDSSEAPTFPESVPTVSPAAQEELSIDAEGTEELDTTFSSGFCTGGEILCLPALTADLVQRSQGYNHGGSFSVYDTFVPSSHGGLEFGLALDVGRGMEIEFEVAGKIPNGHLSEHDGGKLTLFTIQGGSYLVQLQRMGSDYRGGGRFRLILTDRYPATEAAWIVTTADLSGDYTDYSWGGETHTIRIRLNGREAQLAIDHFQTSWGMAPHGIYGPRQVSILLGNREPQFLYLGEAAITNYQNLKISYW